MKDTLYGYVAGAMLALLSTGASAETLVWLSARPAEGAIVTTIKELATEYAKDHPGFELDVQVTADRASRGGSVHLNSPALLLSGASAGFMPLREAVG